MPQIAFAPSDAPALRSAARDFHAREPEPDQELVGYVVMVGRPIEQFDGQAVLQTIVDGKPRRVRMLFDQGDFGTVIKALSDKAPLMVTGDLVRSGARYELQRPRHVAPAPEAAEGELAPDRHRIRPRRCSARREQNRSWSGGGRCRNSGLVSPSASGSPPRQGGAGFR